MFLALFAAAASPAPPVMVRKDERGTYEAMLTEQARDADTFFGGSACPDAVVKKLSSQPVVLKGQPNLAAQSEQLNVTGCGRSTTININVGRYGGSPPWKMVTGLPGDTLTGLELQQSTWLRALKEAGADLDQPCDQVRMGDIYVSARPGHIDVEGPTGQTPPTPGRLAIELPSDAAASRDKFDLAHAWAEVWPLNICGKDRTLSVIFIPRNDQASSFLLFLPIWRAVAEHGPDVLPPRASGN